MHAVILAGGKGVRLRPYTTTMPKPLVPLGDECAILEVVLRQLKYFGFTSITIALGHLGPMIEAYVRGGDRWNLEVDYAYEDTPLGTIGPILSLLDKLPDHFLVMNGDILTDLNYGTLLKTHAASGRPLTVGTYLRDVKIDFGVLEGEDGLIKTFTEKPTLNYDVSMGVYGLSKKTLERYPVGVPFGFDNLMLDLLARKEYPASFRFDGYWLDIGRPEDYDLANKQFVELHDTFLPKS
jgi:NDP-mannose synthase